MKIKNNKRILLNIGFILMFPIFFLSIYTIHDNNRVITARQTVKIDELPRTFEGFTILQITDLHERVFGDGQEKLLSEINSIDYDAIVFTGDMLDDPDSKNYEPFYTLIEGISNKEMAFFVPGNTDPRSFILNEGTSLEKDEFIEGMEERGVQLLDSAQVIINGDSSLFFTYFENSIIKGRTIGNRASINTNQKRRIELELELSILDTLTESDTLIALNHYPIPDKKIDYLKNENEYTFRNFDLIIAGHYHGGQIRLPIIGALFIPESWYSGGGFFPPQDRVKGLWEYKGIQQYVSTGLGSSDAISFLKFRFLNPPEINVLTLKRK